MKKRYDRYIINSDFVISRIAKNANRTIKVMSLALQGVYVDENKDRVNQIASKILHTGTYQEIKNLPLPKILVVRNPYDKIYSAWYNKVLNGTKHSLYGIPDIMQFGTFLDFISTKKNDDINHHFRLQTAFFDDISIFDYVLKMEEQDTWNILEKFFKQNTIHLNRQEYTQEYLTEENRRKIDNIYKKDFEILNYETR